MDDLKQIIFHISFDIFQLRFEMPQKNGNGKMSNEIWKII